MLYPPIPFSSFPAGPCGLKDWTLMFLHPGRLEANTYGSLKPQPLSRSSEGVKLELDVGQVPPVPLLHLLLSQSFLIWAVGTDTTSSVVLPLHSDPSAWHVPLSLLSWANSVILQSHLEPESLRAAWPDAHTGLDPWLCSHLCSPAVNPMLPGATYTRAHRGDPGCPALLEVIHLITCTNSLLPCRITYTQVQGLGRGRLWGHYPVQHRQESCSHISTQSSHKLWPHGTDSL